MKKLFVLSTVLALGALSTFAQGIINANNQGTGVNILVQDPTIASGVATKIGTPATAAGFSTSVGPGKVTIYLYAAANGTSLQSLESSTPIFSGLNSASGLAGNQGTVSIGTSYALPTANGLDGSAPVEFIMYGVSTGGSYTGWSNEGVVQPITTAQAGSGTPSPSIYGGSGITSFVLVPVPEPATIALGGLGAAAVLLFRRRK